MPNFRSEAAHLVKQRVSASSRVYHADFLSDTALIIEMLYHNHCDGTRRAGIVQQRRPGRGFMYYHIFEASPVSIV
jgi:hypothetical protein